MAFTIPNATAPGDDQAEPDKVDIDVLVAGIAGDGVLSGCAVTASGTSDVAVASGSVRIGGTIASVSSGNVTIPDGDATNPRFDLIAVDNAGVKSRVGGTAAANAVFPAIPASSIILAAVYVPATTTVVNAGQVVDKRVIVNQSVLNGINTFSVAQKFSSYLELGEIADPSAPSSNLARLFVRDNGTGLSELCVRFPTGAIMVLATENAPRSMVIGNIAGALVTGTGAARLYNKFGRTLTIYSSWASVGTAPTGSSLIVDVNRGGTTIYTTQANRPTIAVSTFVTTTFPTPNVTTWADGEYLSFDVDQIGSTVAGADLTVGVMVDG